MVGRVEPESPKEGSQKRETQLGFLSFVDLERPGSHDHRKRPITPGATSRGRAFAEAVPASRSSRSTGRSPRLEHRPPNTRPDTAHAPLDPAPAWSEPLQLPALPPEATAAAGEVAKARDLLHAVRVLKRLEAEGRPPTADERRALARFGGFGAVALRIFPDPVTGRYKSPLAGPRRGAHGPPHRGRVRVPNAPPSTPSTPRPPSSRPCTRRSPASACPSDATVLEPGCGTGNFLSSRPEGMRFIGVELDSHLRPHRPGPPPRPRHPHRELPRHALPEGSIDAVIGNVPFADVKLELPRAEALAARLLLRQVARRPEARRRPGPGHHPLHARQAERRRPRVPRRPRPTSSGRSACRPTPSSARARRSSPTSCSCSKRAPGEPAGHADPDWLDVAPLAIEGVEVPINRYFLNHPEMVLGHLEPQGHALRRREATASLGNGDLAEQLRAADPPAAGASPRGGQRRPRHAGPGLHAAAARAAHHRRQFLRRRRPDHLPDRRTGRPCPSSTAARCSRPTAR